METIIIFVFAAVLFGCIMAGYSILWALGLGYLMFFGYAINKGYTVKQVLCMSGP